MSRLRLRLQKALLEIALTLAGWPWWPRASRRLDRLDVAIQALREGAGHE